MSADLLYCPGCLNCPGSTKDQTKSTQESLIVVAINNTMKTAVCPVPVLVMLLDCIPDNIMLLCLSIISTYNTKSCVG